MLKNRFVVWPLVISTFVLILMDRTSNFSELFLGLKTILELYLFFWCAYLIITSFGQSADSRKVIKIRKKSEHFNGLALQGIVIALAQLALVNHYDDIFSFNTVMIAVLFLYFLSQITENSYPKVMLSNTHIGVSDFQMTKIPWNEIQSVRLEPQLLTIQTAAITKSVTLSGLEEYSEEDVERELAAEILDGSVASEGTSHTLSQLLTIYAAKKDFDLESTL